jgi:hypothetical protein
VGDALDVIGNWEVLLFGHTNTGGFTHLSLEFGVTLDIFLLHLELLCHLRKLGRAKHSTNKKHGKNVKQIHVGQRVLEKAQ